MRLTSADWLSGFAYGTVGAIVALSGFGHGGPERAWWQAVLSVVMGGVAVWLAHSYAQLLGARVEAGRNLRRDEFWHALREGWPIVTASGVVASPLLLERLSLVSFESAVLIARGSGIILLAAIGLLAPNQKWSHRLWLATISAVLAIVIVALELAVHG